MTYFITLLEGILTFISPCILPLIPIYLTYLAGTDTKEEDKNKVIINAIGFILGFTILFVVLGNTIAIIGQRLVQNQELIYIFGGIIIIFFGLNYLGVIKLKFLNQTKKMKTNIKPVDFFKSVLFGLVFAAGWTPCVGTFLGAAVISATTSGNELQGFILLILYSIGLRNSISFISNIY